MVVGGGPSIFNTLLCSDFSVDHGVKKAHEDKTIPSTSHILRERSEHSDFLRSTTVQMDLPNPTPWKAAQDGMAIGLFNFVHQRMGGMPLAPWDPLCPSGFSRKNRGGPVHPS